MAIRAAIVHSNITAREFSFNYDGDKEWDARMREIVEADQPDVPAPERIGVSNAGDYNWMTGPPTDAEGVSFGDELWTELTPSVEH
jgi:hypothetical protein